MFGCTDFGLDNDGLDRGLREVRALCADHKSNIMLYSALANSEEGGLERGYIVTKGYLFENVHKLRISIYGE